MATNFVLMLTEKDVTIPDAVSVYAGLSVDALQHVAFKDVGADQGMLRELTDAIHDDGRSASLELADLSDRGQEQGLQLGLDLGVDRVIAQWSPEFLGILESEARPEYWPFLGSLSGSPLKLNSTPGQLAAMATELSRTAAVSGVVLMPYRQDTYDPSVLLERVTCSTITPVLVAGGVSEQHQFECIARAGAWGFTMGGAVLQGRQHDPAIVSRRVAQVLKIVGNGVTHRGTEVR